MDELVIDDIYLMDSYEIEYFQVRELYIIEDMKDKFNNLIE